MKSEMGYKFKGAGHEEPEGKRKYEKPQDGPLHKAVVEYLNAAKKAKSPRDFKTMTPIAEEKIGDIPVSIEEAHALVLQYQEHPAIEFIGYFLSIVYNRAPDKIISYDFEMDNMAGVGHGLSEGKTLLNHGSCKYLGDDAKGLVINYNKFGTSGQKALGAFINCGKEINYPYVGAYSGCLIDFNEKSRNVGYGHQGILIVAKRSCLAKDDTFHSLRDAKPIVLEHCKITELNEYIKDLRKIVEIGRTNPAGLEAELKKFGATPGIRIKEDIESIIWRYHAR